MAKRAPKDLKPYNPIESTLIHSMASPGSEPPPPARQNEVASSPASEVGTTEEAPAQAVEASPPRPRPSRSSSTSTKRSGREKRVILSRSEEKELNQIVELLSDELQTPIKLSNALRACVLLLRESKEALPKQAQRLGPLTRPANADGEAMEAFELELARIFQSAFKQSPALRSPR